jgi:hypothetical protein
MDRRIRATLTVVAAIQAVLAVLFIIQSPLVTGPVWPFEGMTPLSWIFVGSIYLAAAAATAWCIYVDSGRALVGIALDYIAILVPFSVLTILAAVGGGGLDMTIFAVACVLGAIVGIVMLRWALRQRWRDPRPTPRPVRWSFLVFIIALLIVGGLLVLRVPGIMPWNVTPELSTLFGCMFLGAAAYFAFGFLEPRWENAGGQLAGFLAYDVVLIVPFLERLPTVPEALRPNLIVYTGVVIFSGVLAIWYLAIDPQTRVWPRGRRESSLAERA